MNQQNKLIIKNYYEAFNERDFARMIDYLADDVIHDINEGGQEVGRSLFREFVTKMDAHFDETLADIKIMIDDSGARAAAEFLVHGVYKSTYDGCPEATGQKYCLPAGAFFEVRHQKITRVTTYYNLNAWLKLIS